MVLTSRVAQNYEKIIKSGKYEANKMLNNIEAAYSRKLMTLEEKVYLENLIEQYLIDESEEQAKHLKK